jgi:hypothetical protein
MLKVKNGKLSIKRFAAFILTAVMVITMLPVFPAKAAIYHINIAWPHKWVSVRDDSHNLYTGFYDVEYDDDGKPFCSIGEEKIYVDKTSIMEVEEEYCTVQIEVKIENPDDIILNGDEFRVAGKDSRYFLYDVDGWATTLNGEAVIWSKKTERETAFSLSDGMTLYPVSWKKLPNITYHNTYSGENFESRGGYTEKGSSEIFSSPYHFLIGWSETAGGALKYSLDDEIAHTEHMDLYSVWGQSRINDIPPVVINKQDDIEHIYFGGRCWRKIGAGEDKTLLICDEEMEWGDSQDEVYSLAVHLYNHLWECFDEWYEGFSTAEQAAVCSTEKEGGYLSPPLEESKLFMISKAEAITYFSGIEDRKHKGIHTNRWWLRNYEMPKQRFEDDPRLFIPIVDNDGTFSAIVDDISFPAYYKNYGYLWSAGERPAFVLDMTSVLLTSPALINKYSQPTDGSSFGQFGVSEYESSHGEWKLTLLDDAYKDFYATAGYYNIVEAIPGGTVEVNYINALTNTDNVNNRFISAILCNEYGYIVGYATMMSDESTGTWELTLPSNMYLSDGDYTLKVFNEQQNGYKCNDYASPFSVITLTSDLLTATKTAAKAELDTLIKSKNENDYDADDWKNLNLAITEGKAAIDNATTKEAVNTAKSHAFAAVQTIKTKAEKEEADKFTIKQVISEVSAKTGSGMTYMGKPIQLINQPTTAVPDGYTLKYAVTTENTAPDTSAYSTSIPTKSNAGTYYVWYKVESNANNYTTETQKVTVNIAQKTLKITADSASKNYDKTALIKNSFSNTELAEGDSIFSVKVTGSRTTVGTGENIASDAVIKNGETVVTDNYDITYVNGTLTIINGDSKVVTIPAAKTGLVSDGTEQELVSAGTAANGTMVYSLSENGKYTGVIPKGKAAGDYRVWYKVLGDEGYNDTDAAYVDVTIGAKQEPVTNLEGTNNGGTGTDNGTKAAEENTSESGTKTDGETMSGNGNETDGGSTFENDGEITSDSGAIKDSGSTVKETADGSVTETVKEKKDDGSIVTTKSTTNADGTYTTSTKTENVDGSTVTEKETKDADGNTLQTITKSIEKTEDGSTVTTKSTTNADGTYTTSTKTENVDGSTVTEKETKDVDGTVSIKITTKTNEATTVKEEIQNSDKSIIERDTVIGTDGISTINETKTDANGTVTKKEETVKKNGHLMVTSKVTEQDASGKKTKSTTTANIKAKKSGAVVLSEINATGKVAIIPASVIVNGKTVTVTAIGADSMRGNKKLTDVKLGDNITVIGKNAFRGDKNLKNIELTDSIERILKNAFKGIAKDAVFTIKAASEKEFNRVVDLIKQAGVKDTVTFEYVKEF